MPQWHPSMRGPGTGAEAIYTSAEAAKRSLLKLQPIPSFELYKGAREEELLCYRSVCRVICMRSGGRLTKQQTRILEDLREELCIPTQRADAEMLEALEDVLVSSVAASGVLKRREDFFDGVADVPLEAIHDGERAHDDHSSLYAPPAKVPRKENATAGAAATAATTASTSWRRGVTSKNSQSLLLKTIDKIGHEVNTISGKFLSAVSVADQEAFRRELLMRRERLLLLLKEAEGNAIDVSGSSSAIPSEHGF
ncbi:hypothetical protein TCSYLVIO_001523 [Trypanosoma cruzi]|uniref:Uncharacterized protein n=2 Tax=Trypanosoma cruzi TaxID=5693 RepID=V5BAS3_TRYCR|nr:hypothetical protein TCSYLVIO_001523 [Trypanosoma cruzi]ESS70380.1 hypothetical protein TCDM_00847 [Trypanosoma cruzi Dm28c]KAF8287053.1 hypothetical protein TcBrA4_0008870 [Trypanosoma cruzi]PBJ79821.1 hypothetical protein BCY84_02239 [Trypanosoma cruzi cruzi]PWU94009.1 hypothetical protein C4B63_28g81 [Trypanosoma cruzi]